MAWPDTRLRLGTCSWTAEGWENTFYPPGTPRNEFIRVYAGRFNAVEIDSTFYGIPRRSTLERWREQTPPGFLFAAKFPKLITHDKFLDDCAGDLEDFLRAMDLLGDRLGPLLIQFPYFARARGITIEEFADRLERFLAILPRGRFQFAVEVRNKAWLRPKLLELLAGRGIALALIDHPWMAPPEALFRTPGIVTGPFVYIRWLGDRVGIEKITQIWNEVVVDRTKDLERWARPITDLLERGVPVYGFVNNHYAGYAAATVTQLQARLDGAGT